MDFSWVKDLAEEANRKEAKRQEEDRQEKEHQRQLALATPPFVEKLHLLISACSEEFNKYVYYPHLRIVTTRLTRRTKGVENPDDPDLSYPEDVCFFAFSRQDWTYGIRGSKGTVEFLELPSSDGGTALGVDEAGVSPSHKLVAGIENAKVIWSANGKTISGQDIVSICKDYIKELIERTNP